MANCPLTLRITKGSKLTFAELDGNFISLANCISSLPQYDSFVTGGTYNISTNSVDFTGNFDFIPFSTDLSYLANMDITVTGGTYNPSNGTVTFYNNSGGTFQVSGFLTGYTNYYTTGVTLNNTTLEFDRTDLSNAYSVDLSSLIFTGNTSGDCITDLYISNLYGCSPVKVWNNLTLSGSVIDSQGGGYLDLRYGGDGKFYLGNDNGAYSDTFINGESSYLEISAYDPNGKVAIYTDGGNAGIELSNSNSLTNDLLVYTNTLSIMSTPNGYPGGQNLFEVLNDNVLLEGNGTVSLTAYPHSGAGLVGVSADLLIISNTSGSTFTTNSLRETNSSLLSSQYSTILQGVKNSVGLGGYNLNVNSDNTVYVDKFNIKTIGSGTSVINLGLDVNGNVVTGVTSNSGIFGISNSGGVYTYYSTLSLAMSAATAGQTIEMFADVTETGAVSVILKNGVNINGNGHTYTLSNTGTASCLIDNGVGVTASILNLSLRRINATAASSTSTTCLLITGASNIVLSGRQYGSNAYSVIINNSAAKVSGVNASSDTGANASITVYNSAGQLSNSYAENLGNNAGMHAISNINGGFILNCVGVTTSLGYGISNTGVAQNCTGRSSGGGIGFYNASQALNCSGYSSGGVGFYAYINTINENCSGWSSANIGFQVNGSINCKVMNCSGYSTASYGMYTYNGFISNSTAWSTVNYGLYQSNGGDGYGSIDNCVITADASAALFSNFALNTTISNCTIFSRYNNAAGHAIVLGATLFSGPPNVDVLKNTLIVSNASANCLYAAAAYTSKYVSNVFKNATIPVNANITQLVVNTEDNQGNILI